MAHIIKGIATQFKSVNYQTIQFIEAFYGEFNTLNQCKYIDLVLYRGKFEIPTKVIKHENTEIQYPADVRLIAFATLIFF